MPRNTVFKNRERVKTFKKAGPGGLPKKSKLLKNHTPDKLSIRLSLFIGALLGTRIVLSAIPVNFHL